MPSPLAPRRLPAPLLALALLPGLGCGGDAVTGPGTPGAFASGPTLASGTYVTCALTAEGAAYCWGTNGFGTLGQPGITGDTTRPVPVASTRRYVTISATVVNSVAGPVTACALTAEGEADCWGSDPGGLIGPADATPCVDTVLSPDFPGPCVRVPTRVAPTHRFRRISVGAGHICGLVADSTAVCWGRGTEGQLGTGAFASAAAPTPVAGGLRFADIDAGEGFTCGVAADGAAHCWGANAWGQLGDSTLTPRNVPTRVRFAGAFRAVDAGSLRTCGLTTTGAVYCWGSTGARLLGYDAAPLTSAVRTPAPVPAQVPAGARAVGLGLASVCAVGGDEVTRCWGWNFYGQAGAADPSRCGQSGIQSYCLPGRIDVPPLAELRVGTLHACGRTRDGAVYCWGGNFRSESGGPGRVNVLTPQRIQLP